MEATKDSVNRQRTDTAIDGRRLLVAELGHSTILGAHWAGDNPDTISLETLAETQQEQRAGVVLITGAPRGIPNDEIRILFPGWESETLNTDGGAIAVIWNPNHWHAEDFSKEMLTEHPVGEAALCFKLRRATAHSGAVENQFVVLLTEELRNHRGTTRSGASFQAHHATAWDSMFNILRRNGQHLAPRRWMITGSWRSRKAVACVAQGVDYATCHNHDNKQVLVIEVDRGQPDSVKQEEQNHAEQPDWGEEEEQNHAEAQPYSAKEGEQNHAEAQRRQVKLTSFADCFFRALRNAKDDAFEHLAPLLYGPRLPVEWAADGTLLLTPPRQKLCEQKLEFALKLIHEARYQAQKGGWLTAPLGPADDCRQLGNEEMKIGLEWLKCRYRDDYLTRPGLAEDLNVWDSGEKKFDRNEKAQMRSEFRSGLRTFLRDHFGDASLAYAILRNGYSTPQALMVLVRECFDAQKKAKAERERQPNAITRRSHPELAAAAAKARRQFATGKKLAAEIESGTIEYHDLKDWEKGLHQQFHTGKLERQMIKANRDFGQGVGVDQSLSIEPA